MKKVFRVSIYKGFFGEFGGSGAGNGGSPGPAGRNSPPEGHREVSGGVCPGVCRPRPARPRGLCPARFSSARSGAAWSGSGRPGSGQTRFGRSGSTRLGSGRPGPLGWGRSSSGAVCGSRRHREWARRPPGPSVPVGSGPLFWGSPAPAWLCAKNVFCSDFSCSLVQISIFLAKFSGVFVLGGGCSRSINSAWTERCWGVGAPEESPGIRRVGGRGRVWVVSWGRTPGSP